MAWDNFVEEQVFKILVGDGYSQSTATSSAKKAKEHYKRRSGASSKSRSIIDDCIAYGRNEARYLENKKKNKGKVTV